MGGDIRDIDLRMMVAMAGSQVAEHRACILAAARELDSQRALAFDDVAAIVGDIGPDPEPRAWNWTPGLVRTVMLVLAANWTTLRAFDLAYQNHAAGSPGA